MNRGKHNQSTPLPVSEDWISWIVKSLIKSNDPAKLAGRLVEKGFDPDDAQRQVALAAEHPYVTAAKELHLKSRRQSDEEKRELAKQLNNRNWLMELYETLSGFEPGYGTIERVEPPEFNEFVRDYVCRNRPVILVNAIADWPALSRWSPEYFAEKCGDAEVEIQKGRESNSHYEQNRKYLCETLKMRDFVGMVLATKSSNDFYMTAANVPHNRKHLKPLWRDLEGVNIKGSYLTDKEFGSIWFGPRGTITPLHFDMVQNLFCQIYGRKRIRLIPSWNAPWLYNDYHVYSDVDLLNPDLERHPLFARATVYDFVLEPGEVLYIPVAWWHHLESLDVSISLTRKNLALPAIKYGEGYIRESAHFKPYDPREKSPEKTMPRVADTRLLHPEKDNLPGLQTLCTAPRIYYYRDFLSEEECEQLVALARENMVASRVLTDGGLQLSEGRTSSGFFLNKSRDHPIVNRVEERIAGWTGIPVENGEAMHVLNYTKGQEYKAHFDYFRFDKPGREKAQRLGGQRIATVLMYLRDVEEGGETIFPKPGVSVQPRRGDAILFYNVRPDGEVDPDSLHGSLPVIRGEKWTCTKWLRERKLR